MKVIKIIGEGAERRTYVEGGPECEECLNGKVGFGRRIIQPDNKIIWSEGYGECPACDGTGVKPVEEWTDAVKAEWLSDNIPEHFSWAIENGYYVYTICQGEFTGERETELAENDDFSAALTAAVLSVARAI